MRRALRIGGLLTLAIVIPLVVATATYAIGVRSLAPATRLQVSVIGGSDPSPAPGRTTPDDRGGSSTGNHGATGAGGESTSGGIIDDHGGDSSSGSGDGSNSGPGSGDSGSGGSSGSGSGSGHGGGDD
jgi:hypothetical protein